METLNVSIRFYIYFVMIAFMSNLYHLSVLTSNAQPPIPPSLFNKLSTFNFCILGIHFTFDSLVMLNSVYNI